jgi:hypothetical protein
MRDRDIATHEWTNAREPHSGRRPREGADHRGAGQPHRVGVAPLHEAAAQRMSRPRGVL